MNTRIFYTAIIFILSIFMTNIALAQSAVPDPIIDWQKRVTDTQRLTSLGDNLMGDSIDYNTGSVSFEHTDVSIPGNNSLQVAVRRRLTRGLLYDQSNNAEFGDWEIVVPRITATTAEETNFRTGARCSSINQFQKVPIKQKANPSNPYYNNYFTPFLYGHQYASGIQIDTLEYGNDKLLRAQTNPKTPFPNDTEYVTKSNFKVSCLGNINDGGEGFLATSPDGLTYRFDHFYDLRGEDQLFSNLNDASAIRYRSIIAATEVTDVHGNWVRYDYDSQNRLIKIHSNDNREITLSYQPASGLINQVTTNGRVWNYEYGTGTQSHQYVEWGSAPILSGQTFTSLTKMIRPDGLFWEFISTEMSKVADLDGCTVPSATHTLQYTVFGLLPNMVRMKHPSGVTGDFTFENMRRRVGDVLETKSVRGRAAGLYEWESSGNINIQNGQGVTLACSPIVSIDQTLMPDAPDLNASLQAIAYNLALLNDQLMAAIAAALAGDAQYLFTSTDENGRTTYHNLGQGDWITVAALKSQIKAAEGAYYYILGERIRQSMTAPPDNEANPVPSPTLYPTKPANLLMYRTMRALVEKKLSAPNIDDAIWQIDYQETPIVHYTNLTTIPATAQQDRTNWTKVVAPNGTEDTFYYHWDQEGFGGELKRKESREFPGGSNVLHIIENEYTLEPDFTGRPYFPTIHPPARTLFPVRTTKRIITQDGDIYTSEYGYGLNPTSPDYSFGNPVRVEKYSNISTTPLVTATEVKHDTNLWILGLPEKITVNGREEARYEYDALGQKDKQFRYGALNATFGYNTDGTPAWIEDANNRRTNLMQWKRGKPQQIQRPDTVILYQDVDDNGWLTSTTNANGHTTSYVRDNMGRLTEYHPPIQSPTYVNYDFTGPNPTQTITRGPKTQTITYDSMFRPTLVNVGGEIYTKTDYDAAGRKTFESYPSSSSNPSHGITYTYDGLSRLKTVSNAAGTTTHGYYANHLHRVTGPTGAAKDYYSRGYQGPNNKDYAYIYEHTGGVYERQTAINKNIWGEVLYVRQFGSTNGHTVDQFQFFEYDAQRRLCRRTTPEGGHTVYRYDPAGQVIDYSQETGMGTGCGSMTPVNRTTHYYDILGRLFYVDYWTNATEDTVSYYDANGNVTSLLRGLGSGAVGANRTVWNYSYNAVDQLLTESLEIDSEIYDLSYVYDPHGRLTKRTLPGGSFVDIVPDALGRDNSVSYTYLDPNNQTPTLHALGTNMLYHPNGSSASLNYGNGHTYASTLNNLQQVTHAITSNGTTPAFDRYYTYDARGLINTITSGIDSTYDMNFTYDGLGQLTTAHGYWGDAAYDYDSLGNIHSKTIANWEGTTSTRTVAMSYDNTNNRLTAYTDTHGSNKTLAYDFRGNVTALGGQGFYYGLTNQPQSLTGTHTGAYTYDGNLRRVRSEIGGVKIFNVYDASGTLVHIDDKGTGTKTDYVKGAGMTLARIKNGVPTYLHPDHLGSAAAGTDASGTVTFQEYYTPFGMAKNNPASNDNQAGFTGHIKDAATGLNYMQARYYDPVIGRFLSIDPVTFLDTGDPRYFNRYAYTANDPINMTDPDGRQMGISPSLGCHGTGGSNCFEETRIAVNYEAAGVALGSAPVLGGLACAAGGCQALGTAYLSNPMLFNGLAIGAARVVGDPGRNPVGTAPTKVVPLLSAPKMQKHHIFNVFRGGSASSQVYRDFFKSHGIKLDNYTVSVTTDTHKRLHQAGNNWTTKWKSWIDANPNASTKDVYQQAGKMMDEYGIKDVKIEPYR